MIKIEFNYNSNNSFILAINEDKMRKVCSKFTQKIQLDLNNIYFMYSGNIVNLDLSVEQIINNTDKERKIMSIIVMDYSKNLKKIIKLYCSILYAQYVKSMQDMK